jgi:hypothetical protein
MTPKEKAKDLVIDKYGSNYPIICKMSSRNMYRSEAKQCALIAVDEILKLHKKVALETLEFYQQVKQEIQAL